MMHDFALKMADVESGQADVIRCPDCGQMEIWSREEKTDHGMCRTSPTLDADGTCPVCGDVPLAAAENRARAEAEEARKEKEYRDGFITSGLD